MHKLVLIYQGKQGPLSPGIWNRSKRTNKTKKKKKKEESARIRPFFGFRFDNRPDNLPLALKRAKDEGSYLL